MSEANAQSGIVSGIAHLPLPFATQLSEKDRIPYRSRRSYDNGPFLDFPNRVDWPQVLPTSGFFMYDQKHPAADDVLEEFLQTWLFFGLLHELLGSAYCEERYLVRDQHGVAVHTMHLKHDLEAWSRTSMMVAEEERRIAYAHLRVCLVWVGHILKVTQPNFDSDTTLIAPRHISFNRAIRQSIAILAETISHAVDETFPQPNGPQIPLDWPNFYTDDELLSNMTNNNWCYSEAMKVRTGLAYPSSLHFVERLKRLHLDRDHCQCNPEQCDYLTINDKTYRTRHVDEKCSCKDLHIELGDIGSILDHGGMPLLRLMLTGDGSIEIGVESSQNDRAFVALSHVWAGGLGNRKGNSLPQCQLVRLAVMIDNLRGSSHVDGGQPEQRDLLFWCDTLCVPVDNENASSEQKRWRDLAMGSMRKVYRNAAYVLVLDRTLELYSINDIGLTEAAFRIMFSPWTCRLWTLQEGVLPDNLLFQFADRPVDLREIWRYHVALRREDVTLVGMCRDITGWCRLLRLPFHSDERLTLGMAGLSAVHGLRGRRVSVATDEPLCLATLFELDMTQLQRVPKGKRMEEVWKLMPGVPGGIPGSIVFNPFPRLAIPGFQWAPSTFLIGPVDRNLFHCFSTDIDQVDQGQITQYGLLVKFPAVVLRRASPVGNLALPEFQGDLKHHEIAQLRDVDGGWYFVNTDCTHGRHDEDKIRTTLNSGNAVLLMRNKLGVPDYGQAHQTALLALRCDLPLEGAETSTPSTQVLCSVANMIISRVEPGKQLLWSKAYDSALELHVDELSACETLQATLQDQEPQGSGKELANRVLSIVVSKANKVCVQDPTLLAAMQSLVAGSPVRHLAGLIFLFFMGRYLAAADYFDKDHEWFVD